jgi:hypothetical protein
MQGIRGIKKIITTKFEKYVHLYREYLTRKNFVKDTIIHSLLAVRTFFSWMSENCPDIKTLDKITKNEIIDFPELCINKN